MGIYKYIRKLWQQPKANMPVLYKERLVKWRKQPAVVRIARPTRLDRARSVGYTAKQGIILARVRVQRGGHTRTRPNKGRRSKRMHINKNLNLSYQTIAERRANVKCKNCEVLNSYQVALDGKHYWYEVILIDRNHPAMKADKKYAGLTLHRGRAFRGKTSSNRKTRGLRRKGKGAEKVRPSRPATRSRKTKGLKKKIV